MKLVYFLVHFAVRSSREEAFAVWLPRGQQPAHLLLQFFEKLRSQYFAILLRGWLSIVDFSPAQNRRVSSTSAKPHSFDLSLAHAASRTLFLKSIIIFHLHRFQSMPGYLTSTSRPLRFLHVCFPLIFIVAGQAWPPWPPRCQHSSHQHFSLEFISQVPDLPSFELRRPLPSRRRLVGPLLF